MWIYEKKGELKWILSAFWLLRSECSWSTCLRAWSWSAHGLWTEKIFEVISKFVIKLALPVMIFINTVNGVERKLFFIHWAFFWLRELCIYVCFYSATYLVFFFICMVTTGSFTVPWAYSEMWIYGYSHSNQYLSGKRYALHLCIYHYWSAHAVDSRCTPYFRYRQSKKRFDFRKLINPVTVSIFLAVICVLTGIRLPEVLNNSLQKIGQTATPLAMIYLGGVFTCIDVLKNIRRLDYYGIVILKMLLFPLFFYVLLGYLPVSSEIRTTMALTSAMPVMSLW